MRLTVAGLVEGGVDGAELVLDTTELRTDGRAAVDGLGSLLHRVLHLLVQGEEEGRVISLGTVQRIPGLRCETTDATVLVSSEERHSGTFVITA